MKHFSGNISSWQHCAHNPRWQNHFTVSIRGAEPHDIMSHHLEVFTFSRQCSQHCLIYYLFWMLIFHTIVTIYFLLLLKNQINTLEFRQYFQKLEFRHFAKCPNSQQICHFCLKLCIFRQK